MKTVEKNIKTTFYIWDCPRCKITMEDTTKPRTEYCLDCEEKNFEEEEKEFVDQFKASNSYLLGATIIDFETDTEYWWDQNPETAEIDNMTIKLKDGTLKNIHPLDDGWALTVQDEK